MKKVYTVCRSLLFLTAMLSIKVNKLKAQVDVNDSLALVALYNSTDGPHWKKNANWLTSSPVRSWFGIDVKNKRVTSLSLVYNNLNGNIPAEIGNLTALEKLYLYNNQLNGSIPAGLGNLSNLRYLYINNNQLSGSIPPELGNLKFTHDAFINLSGNQLSGSIPSELGNIQFVYAISSLNLSFNKLSGSIPPELGNLKNLAHLYINNNQLSGNIPADLGNMTNLEDLQLNNNQLSGSIPPELSKTNLSTLFLNNNQLSGNIPLEIVGLTYLRYLRLGNNQLSGSIPSALGELRNLWELDLSNNQFSGEIPSELSKPHYLNYLDLSNNHLTGKIPQQFGRLVYMYHLDLSNNELRDSIPERLGDLKNLSFLSLRQNNLKGEIPSSFSNLINLKELNIGGNRLNGNLPSFLSSLTLLKKLSILNNYFTFDGLETLTGKDFETFRYFSQGQINIHQNSNTLSVYAGGTLSNNTYKWFKDGSLVATLTGDSTFTPTSGGAYNVEVTNSIATELTLYSDTITITTLHGLQQTNISSIQSINKNSFSVYPNPAKDVVTTSFGATGNYTLKLTDINGKILQTKTGIADKTKNILQLNVNAYAAGEYFVTISDGTNKAQTFKLQKQ